MPKGLFERFGEADIHEQVKKLKLQSRDDLRKSYDFAVDYLENRQEEDIEQQLLDRFPSSQTGDTGQQIYPITMPLTKRYIDESANAYNRTVKRNLVMPDGSETDGADGTREQSKILNQELDAILYDEIMHRNDQFVHLLASSGILYQQKRGKIEAQLTLPQNINPIADNAQINPANQDDFSSHVVELFWALGDALTVQKRTFAFISRGTTAFYQGGDIDKIEKLVAGPFDNPFMWPQVPEHDPSKLPPPKKDLPLMPLTIWHREYPFENLIPQVDPDIAIVNRELNIAWTIIFDTLRFQGHDTPVKKLLNPDDPKALQRHGARFPVIMDIGETFEYAHSAASYTEMVNALMDFQKLMAVLKRLSPNDFSIEGVKAASGFAKLVDSLPKIQAREQRLRSLKYYETVIAWPRIASILIWLKKLSPKVKEMRLMVEFPPLEFPKTPAEVAQEIETNINHNLDTPAHILARRRNISVEEATEEVMKNAELNKKLRAANPPPQQQQPGIGMVGFGLGNRIGQRERTQGNGNRDAGSSPRLDRQQRDTEGAGSGDNREGGAGELRGRDQRS